MENLKHTKGEWVYQVTKKDEIGVKMPNGNFLRLGFIYSDDCGLPTCCRVEEHANAKLIAAAPDLLEALIRAEQSIRLTDAKKSPLHKLMLNAIKKATE